MKYRKIVIEGIDGAGKDTQINRLKSFLEEKNQKCEVLKYPDTKSPIGKIISEFLKNKFDFSSEVQFLLYAADMLKDKEKIEKWVNEGKTVLFNRYITSTLAYQGTQGFPFKRGNEFIRVYNFPRPDIIFYLKISASTALKRKKKQKKLDRFESKKDFLEKISDFYDKLEKEKILGKWVVIDGEKSREEVFEEVRKALGL